MIADSNSGEDCPKPFERAPRAVSPPGTARYRLFLAPPSLQGAVVSIITRDTRSVELTPAQRLSHIPSTPLVSLSWFHGSRLGIIEGNDAAYRWRPFEPGVLVTGSRSASSVSWSTGRGQGGIVSFTAEVARTLLGIDVAAVQDRFVPAQQVLGPEHWQFLEELFVSEGDAQIVRVLEEHLAPRWQAIQERPTSAPSLHQVGRHWVARLMLQAHEWRGKQSLRQIERRIKAQSGRSLREWQLLVKSENMFFEARSKLESGVAIKLADFALDEGFSDQAHLSRATKRMTGFSPTQFAPRYLKDESFWIYRLWL
jgi:AraC-like DNA-binding protein